MIAKVFAQRGMPVVESRTAERLEGAVERGAERGTNKGTQRERRRRQSKTSRAGLK